MKVIICILLLGFISSLHAQEEPVRPEPSEPPFKVGDLPMQSGYTIKREGKPDLNFRIVENKMRLYWIDEEGLIAAPGVPAVSLRFDDRSIPETMREYHRLKRLSDDAGLGSPYFLRLPHLYYITLLVPKQDSEEYESYRFRYTPEMDEIKEPTSD